MRVTPYLGAAGSNYYAHPVEGVAALRRPHQPARSSTSSTSTATRPSRVTTRISTPGPSRRSARAAPPIQVTTPQGPGYRIEDGEVRWEKWRFRFALHPREGLVLYTRRV